MRRRRFPSEDEMDEGGHRPVRQLRDALGEVADDLRLDDPDVLGAVLVGWGAVVGEAVAAHARARSLREGTLLVEVDSPEWATQLRYLEEDLLRRLGRRVRPGAVTGIRVVVGPRP
jgi:predicted nucleic acid-binding Zn ribbon protein